MKELLGKIWHPTYAQIDLKNVTLKIVDGTTPVANYIEIKIGEGNFTYTETVNREYTLDRGRLDQVRNGDEAPVDVSFDFVWEYITSNDVTGATPTVEDALKRVGAAAAWATTGSDPCAPYTVDLVLENVPVCTAEGDQEIITIADFLYESLAHDLRAGTVAVTGKANVTEATVVRSAIV